ncbi:MAG TPA: GGDEF domain-containing protein [Burkholderiaceae bacterium]
MSTTAITKRSYQGEDSLPLLSFPFIPSQSRFSRHWHLCLYRFGLPLVTLGYMIHVAYASSKMDQLNGAICALMFFLSLTLTYVWGARAVFATDVLVTLTLWGSLLNGIVQLALFHSSDSIPILQTNLIWAPVIAVYWGMAFYKRWLFGLLQTILYYVAFLCVDPLVLFHTSKNLLPYPWHLMLAQGVALMLLMAIFANVAKQFKISEARWRKAAHHANHDQLTGLLNRRTFSRHLPRIVKISDAEKLKLSLMLIDFDHFKLINDRYGHSAGDNILQQVAKLFTSVLRAGDSLYRWGGEEFVIILRDTDATTLSAIAERLRALTEQHPFGLKRSLTISIGLATYEAGETHENFFKRADAAMLCAKRNGRNRVELASHKSRPIVAEIQQRTNGTNG